MKKQLAGFLAVMFAGAMCIGLAACGESEGSENAENGGGTSQEEVQKFVMTAETDLHSLKSDVVTEAEWKAAFSTETFENFFLVYSVGSREQRIELSYDGKKADGKVFMVTGEGETKEEKLFQHIVMNEKTEGTVTVWNNVNGAWAQGGDFEADSNDIPYNYRTQIAALGQKFSDFSYDETLGCYKTQQKVFQSEGECFVVIKDGTLCGLWQNMLNEEGRPEEGTTTIDMILCGRNAQTVTLPE